MSPLEQIAVAWQALLRTIGAMRRPALWAPFALLGAAEAGVILLLWRFAHPWISWFMGPLVRRMAGESALRYPDSFRALPGLYAQADTLVGLSLGAVVVGAATFSFAAYFRGSPAEPGEGLRVALRRSVVLVLASLPVNAIGAALPWAIGSFLASRGSGGLVHKLAGLVGFGASLILQALFLYISALVVLERRNLIEAFAELPRTWARGFWAAFLLGALLLLPLMPLQFLADRVGLIVDRGVPELAGVLVLAQAAVSLAVWFLLAGSATLVYLTLIRDEDSP